MLSGKSTGWGVRTWLLLTPAYCVLARKPRKLLKACHLHTQSQHDCPPRPFCRGLTLKKVPVQLERPLWDGFRASLPSPAPPLRRRPCSVKHEGGPPGKPEERGPLNYGAAFLALLRKAQVPQLNNSPPQEDPVVPATAEVGQASARPQAGAAGLCAASPPALGGAQAGKASLAGHVLGWSKYCNEARTTRQEKHQPCPQHPLAGINTATSTSPPQPPSGVQIAHPPATPLPTGPAAGWAPRPSQHLAGVGQGILSSHAGTSWGCKCHP